MEGRIDMHSWALFRWQGERNKLTEISCQFELHLSTLTFRGGEGGVGKANSLTPPLRRRQQMVCLQGDAVLLLTAGEVSSQLAVWHAVLGPWVILVWIEDSRSLSGNWHMTQSKVSNALCAKGAQLRMVLGCAIRKRWILISGLPLLDCVTLGSLQNLSEPQCLYL